MLISLSVIIVIFTFMPILVLVLSHGALRRGNRKKYDLQQTKVIKDSPLRGKTIIFLGDAVTYGSASGGKSFVEYLEKQNGIIAVKATEKKASLLNEKNSYISKMKTLNPDRKVDAFVCQLSVRDASRQLPLGVIARSYDPAKFDIQTITGALELIIQYAKTTWNCPVIFYTNPRYASKEYDAMVNCLLELEKKWKIGVLDMWNDSSMQLITKNERRLYMVDSIHPTRAGYRDWWTPKFEECLEEYLR